MTDEERQKLCAWLRNPWGNYEELCRQAADELERLANAEVVWKRRAEAYLKIADDKAALAQSDAEPDAQKKLEEATAYAEQLAISLAARWYPEVSQWKPLSGDLIGLLTQIDNMTTGAMRAQSDAEPEYHPDGRRRGRSRLVYDKEKRTIVPELRQSDTEPSRSVTMSDAVDQMAMALHDEWYGVGGWSSLTDFERKRWQGVAKVALTQSLPPRPDASAGLIEAAKWHEELAKEKLEQAKRASGDKKRRFLDISFFHDECASALRTHAAERSGK